VTAAVVRADERVVARERRRAERRHVAARVGVYMAAIFAAFACAMPFLWASITAFKQDQDLYNPLNNPFTFNPRPTWANVSFLFAHTNFTTFALNTLEVGGLVVLITLALALPAAYSLARLPVRWGSGLGVAIFMVYLVPPSLLFISLSKIVSVLGLQDSKWSLVLVYPTLTVPVAVWLLLGFFKAVPRDIEDQALVDGYSRLATFWRVAVPLALPGIVAVVVFAFTLAAHEFIYALAFVSPTNEKTISVGVPTELIRGDVFFWQSLEAAGIIIAIPLAFAFTLLLERFITGFTMGAVKG
jgi:multiple sugar transport system permease protein